MLAIADDAAAANFETHLLVADYADAYTDDAAAAYYITYVADYDAGDAAAAPSPTSPLPRADYGDAAAAADGSMDAAITEQAIADYRRPRRRRRRR